MNIGKLRADLEADEGIKHETYMCSENKLTFGVGHLVLQSDPEYRTIAASSSVTSMVFQRRHSCAWLICAIN